jgi:hypothetical protein
LNDLDSLRVKEEITTFDDYVSSVEGVHKVHFEILLSQYGKTLEKLDEQMRLEKEYAHDIASLKNSLDGEEEERATLEEKLDSIEESNNEVISKLIKERDHAHAKVRVPSSSTSTCEHANSIEENARLKDELAKSTIPIGEKNLNDLLSKQKAFNDKMGLGFVSKNKKKSNKKKKAKPAQAKKDPIVGGKATHDDLAGIANHH